jgi:hypothetical protein
MNIVENHLTLQKTILFPFFFCCMFQLLSQQYSKHMVRLQVNATWTGSIVVAKAYRF